MSEEDYEVDEKGGKKVHKLRLSVEELLPLSSDEKRAAKSASGSSKQKRRRSPSPSPAKGSSKRKRYCRHFYIPILYFFL